MKAAASLRRFGGTARPGGCGETSPNGREIHSPSVMKQKLTPLRRATGLLLAAAALPLTPLAAQEVQTTPPPYAGDGTTPPADVGPSPVEPVLPQPTVTTPAPIATTPIPVVSTTTVDEPAPARTTAATSPRPRATAPVRPAPVVRSAPPAVADSAPSTSAAVAPAAPAPAAEAPIPVPAPEAVPVDAAVPVTTEDGGGAIWPWLLGGVLLIAALFLFARRRRRASAEVYEETYQAAPEPLVERESVLAAAPSDGPDPLVAAAAVAGEPAGRPWIDLQMRPVRAGVTGEGAVVEFELTVDNEGNAPARDVRISTFMLAAGSPQESEMERMLIEPPAGASLPEVDLDAGQAKRVEAAVALPTSGLADAVLPVVVADARYTLPDGSEGRTSASFAVGVAIDDELAHFDVEHPSGLHDDVEARLRGEPERV